MDIQQLMNQIKLPEEGQLCISEYIMPEAVYQGWRTAFYRNESKFFQKAEESSEKELLLLYLYIRFAADIYPSYKEAGISDLIYYNTFSDFTIWFLQCVRQKHTIGLIQEKWLKLHLKMKLFRLGRLQFEKDEAENQIHIHIPEGEALSPESCDSSLQQAEDFFGGSCALFTCESWLLSPVLPELLDEESNIIQFQKRFQVTRVNWAARQAEERVFGEIREDKNSYPENTTLQRTLKKYLLAGKNPGVGYGILKS